MMMLKSMQDWLLPLVIMLGMTGGFPQPPAIFFTLSQFELYRWALVFFLVYGLGSHDVQNALIITISFYLASKLLALRDAVQSASMMAGPSAGAAASVPEDAAAAEAAEVAAAEAAAAAAAAAAKAAAEAEGFCGGGCGPNHGGYEGFCGGGSCSMY
jgi:uncharacterized low-complexity protein